MVNAQPIPFRRPAKENPLYALITAPYHSHYRISFSKFYWPPQPATIFQIHLVLGYMPWLLFLGAYVWPKLGATDPVEAHRAIATLHSFRFFGLVFIIPGVVGANLPSSFAAFAAYGDFATGVLAMLALLTVGKRPLFWPLVVAFNVVGAADILIDYYHGIQIGLPALAGELGATYAIPIIYVPLLMITHVLPFYLLVRPQLRVAIS